MFKPRLFAAALAMLSAPAQAFFFIMIPIPRGNADPDKIEANLEQRHHAMCVAYHLNVIDPNLSGKKEASWHGEVMQIASEKMAAFPNHKKLAGTYVRQWQLQAKNNFQAGMSYSQMLANACLKIDLPYDKSQYDNWKKIKSYFPNASNYASLSLDAAPIDAKSWFENIDLPKLPKAYSVKETVVHVRTDATGKAISCEVDKSSADERLDLLACSTVIAKGRFSPQINGFAIAGGDVDMAVSWPDIYARATSAPRPTQAPAVDNDPVLSMAMNRCSQMGHLNGSASYKSCIAAQIDLISKR